jgi:hypothetical protein
MTAAFIISVIGIFAGLFVYMKIEKRSGHRKCPACGFSTSIDSPDIDCPRCCGRINRGQAVRGWPKWALIVISLTVATVDCAVLFYEGAQSGGEKAIRLVKESRSRKENSTVQQYLYSTVYHRRDNGEDVEIRGWRYLGPGEGGRLTVEFSFVENGKTRVGVWEVDLAIKKTSPQNDVASEISWN